MAAVASGVSAPSGWAGRLAAPRGIRFWGLRLGAGEWNSRLGACGRLSPCVDNAFTPRERISPSRLARGEKVDVSAVKPPRLRLYPRAKLKLVTFDTVAPGGATIR